MQETLVWSPCNPRDSQESSSAQFNSFKSLVPSLPYGPTLASVPNYWKNHSFDYTNFSQKICLIGASLVVQLVKNLPEMRETWVQSLAWEDSAEGRHGNPLLYSCPENPSGQRYLAGYSPWDRKELDMTERQSTHFLPLLCLFQKLGIFIMILLPCLS